MRTINNHKALRERHKPGSVRTSCPRSSRPSWLQIECQYAAEVYSDTDRVNASIQQELSRNDTLTVFSEARILDSFNLRYLQSESRYVWEITHSSEAEIISSCRAHAPTAIRKETDIMVNALLYPGYLVVLVEPEWPSSRIQVNLMLRESTCLILTVTWRM